MSTSSITVTIDNRVRLLSTLLALTTWPEQEQDAKPHGVHAHARATRAALAEFEHHPAVLAMQEALESGQSLSEIFSYAAYLVWPDLTPSAPAPEWSSPGWAEAIRDFATSPALGELWERDAPLWDDAVSAAQRALAECDPRSLLIRLFGSMEDDLIFLPNLCYPTSETLCYRDAHRLICISPPPVAWGTNPPWPYNDNPADPAREAFGAYARLLLGQHLAAHPDSVNASRKAQLPIPNTFKARTPDWSDQLIVLVVSGATAIFLRDQFGKAEADAYVMMSHKAHGFEAIPSIVSLLEHYFTEQAAGKYQTFMDYLPDFAKNFRVAEKMKKV